MPDVDLILQGYSVNADVGRLGFCGVTLIRGSRNILVDVAQVGRRDLLVSELKRRNLEPENIDAVVLTHAHWDHMLNIDLFPNAQVYLHPREREYIKSPHPEDFGTPRYTSLILEQCNLVEIQEGQEVDDGVQVIDTPGHTRGSITLVVQTPAGPVNICGDALPTAITALMRLPSIIFWDEEEARRSAVKILDHSQTLYPGHDKPFCLHGSKVEYLPGGAGMVMNGMPDPLSGEFEVRSTPLNDQPIFVLATAKDRQRERAGGGGA